MNILPKKSWHVLNKDNIAKVRRDEAQARAEEEEKASRAAIAEQEARLGAMRKRAREKDGVEEEERGGGKERGRKEKREECSVTDASGHINFFTDLQKGIGLQVGNVEREKEMKQEQEKLEKRIGLLNYLVDKDKSDNVPWYVKSGRGGAGVEAEGRKSAKAEARKELQDPLLEMRGHLEAKRKREEVVGVVGGVVSGAGAVQGISHSSSQVSQHGIMLLHTPSTLGMFVTRGP
ncbi:Leukocyte receptor cluster member 1 homolog [Geodia barretti]|uniref:Leukocyte receptor cluster member 1 homolog n=1 Tax=Geodia barretti TaxID=519541 RepID=A0AA35RFZ5_GEOBA|nr:Leukocyte receptor cluster member 1 homolog [Geodia barretti]